jgi:hydrogenase/urease accessory protein HupE
MHMSILLAHAGHAGDHGWLAGALQPLLSVDHLLAGLSVAVVLSVGLWRVASRAAKRGVTEAADRR